MRCTHRPDPSGVAGGFDAGRAKSLYESVADVEPAAMRQLGFLYDRGIGVPKDYREARKLYEKAAALGDAIAINNLGYMYEAGNGVPKDLGRARDLYGQAAALGQLLAMVNLGNLYRNGRGVPKDYAQARQWYEKAAAGGRTAAMVQLGDLYRLGSACRRTPRRPANGTKPPLRPATPPRPRRWAG